MAGGEDQGKFLGGFIPGCVVWVCHRGRHLEVKPAPGFGAPGGIDYAPPGHRGQPGTGPVGNAVRPPVGQRLDERVLERIFGPRKVAAPGDEARDDTRCLVAKGGLDQPGAGGFRFQLRESYDLGYSNTMIGRTSTLPYLAVGIFAAHDMASSISLQSTR